MPFSVPFASLLLFLAASVPYSSPDNGHPLEFCETLGQGIGKGGATEDWKWPAEKCSTMFFTWLLWFKNTPWVAPAIQGKVWIVFFGKGKKILFVLFFLLLIPVLIYFLALPDIGKLSTKNPVRTAFMEYREKEWAKQNRSLRIQQIWVPLARVSPYLLKAVLIAEDDKFWKHEGFDFESIQKAIEKDLQVGRFKFGGSTISQQLARNLYLSPDKSVLRKMAEAILTWKMERALSKKRILEIYLNVVEWGEGIFGAEAASRHYFRKPARDLTSQEAARLAAVLPNPRKYNPAGEQKYVEIRARRIQEIMVRRGIVAPEYEETVGKPKENSP
jgi:monofunctional biosynthetic peptidoglycan transglycosylase